MALNIINQLNEYLAPLVIVVIILLMILFVVVIPVLRLGVGYLKNIFTSQRKVPQKITIIHLVKQHLHDIIIMEVAEI